MKFVEDKIDINYIELVIFFASYEERSIAVANHLVDKGYKGDVIIFFCEDLPQERIILNLSKLSDLFGSQLNKIPISYHDPFPMIESVKQINFPSSILVDISCFNRGNLFPFLWASRIGRDMKPDLTFAYTAPESYGSWLSADYDHPKNIVGFAGSLDIVKDRALICIVGYEAERALSVIQAVEPSKVILTVGTIPTKEEFISRNQTTVKEVHGSINYEIREINVNEPDKCMEDLLTIINKIEFRTEIHFAPFSTKLSCLAVWKLWLQDNKYRIWNAQPKTYNLMNYSKGSIPPRYFSVQWNIS